MALASTTLAGACDAYTNTISVTSATGFAAGSYCKVDAEIMKIQTVSGTQIGVFRGVRGSRAIAHTVYAAVCVGTAAEFAAADSGGGPGSPTYVAPNTYTYAVAGAIALKAGLHVIGCGAGEVKAMTLAAPSYADDGMELTVLSASAYAHTVTYTAGFYGDTTSSDVATFAAKVGPSITFIARKGVWGVKAVSAVGTTANVVIA